MLIRARLSFSIAKMHQRTSQTHNFFIYSKITSHKLNFQIRTSCIDLTVDPEAWGPANYYSAAMYRSISCMSKYEVAGE